jgi:riboflavin kinase / FMN adenylyltransferase
MTDRLDLPGEPLPPGSSAITVGTFDGVHLGHRAVLDRLVSVARQRGLTSIVVTFEPHPLRVVRPEAAPRQLCTAAEKSELLGESGVERVAIVPFTRELAGYSPRRFVEKVLLSHFGLAHLVIGYDHGFGKDRSGDAATLQSLGEELQYDVTVVPHTDLDARPISSTRIRLLLSDGDVVDAARALGRPYSLDGRVVPGEGRGRSLGFPTANLEMESAEKLLPAEGIYAVRAQIDAQGPDLRGVLHLGPRPTFGGARPTVEVYLLDVEEDLYGRLVRVKLCGRIRAVQRFATAEDLVLAMHGDVDVAQRLLEGGQGACT